MALWDSLKNNINIKSTLCNFQSITSVGYSSEFELTGKNVFTHIKFRNGQYSGYYIGTIPAIFTTVGQGRVNHGVEV